MDDSLKELLERADSVAKAKQKAEASTEGNYYLNAAKKGVAQGLGNIMDVGGRAYNLGKAAIGMSELPTLLGAVTGKPSIDFMPDVSQTGVLGANVNTDMLKNMLGVRQMQPSGPTQQLLGALTEGAAGGLTSPSGIGGLGADFAKSALISGAAGLGGEMGGMATKDSWQGRLLGSLVGGVAAPAALAKYPSGASSLLNNQTANAARTNAAPFVERIVEGQTKRAVQGAPDAADNITQALALRAKIPGFNPSVAEMADTPALLDMQRRYAMSSPLNINAETARHKANEQAIQQYFSANAPRGGAPTSVRSSVNQSIAEEQAAAQARATGVANKVPSTDQFALGGKMEEIANAERAAARPAITAAYEKAFNADTSKAVDLAPVISKAEEILGTKLSQVKPESAPNTVAAILKLKPQDVKPSGFGFTQELTPSAPGSATVTLRDIDGIRKAINADIAEAGRSTSPVAATQLRNLYQLHKTIDDSIAASGLNPAAKTAYTEAVSKYRTEFVPRFKEGTNMRMFQENSFNEPKIIPDKFTSEYFKPDSQGGLTRANQFGNLFGKNAEATQTTKAGILDKYRDAVVDKNTGVIDIAAHNRFIATHKDTLQAFKKSGVNAVDDISSIGAEATKVMNFGKRIEETAKGLKFDTVDQLVDAALKNPRIMGNTISRLGKDSKEQFQRILMNKAMEGGASGMSDFIQNNKQTLKMALTTQHLSSLDDVSSALKIMERAPIKGTLATEGPDIVKNMSGVSTATVWAQYRATTAGRQGLATGIFNLAAPVATKLGQKEFSEIMENALHNPETAKNLRDFLLATSPAQANKAGAALANVKSGVSLLWDARKPVAKYMLGTRYYPSNIARSQSVLADDDQNQGNQ